MDPITDDLITFHLYLKKNNLSSCRESICTILILVSIFIITEIFIFIYFYHLQFTLQFGVMMLISLFCLLLILGILFLYKRFQFIKRFKVLKEYLSKLESKWHNLIFSKVENRMIDGLRDRNIEGGVQIEDVITTARHFTVNMRNRPSKKFEDLSIKICPRLTGMTIKFQKIKYKTLITPTFSQHSIQKDPNNTKGMGSLSSQARCLKKRNSLDSKKQILSIKKRKKKVLNLKQALRRNEDLDIGVSFQDTLKIDESNGDIRTCILTESLKLSKEARHFQVNSHQNKFKRVKQTKSDY